MDGFSIQNFKCDFFNRNFLNLYEVWKQIFYSKLVLHIF